MVYQMYARKGGHYFVNKVTRFQMEDLRPDLIERAWMMTAGRSIRQMLFSGWKIWTVMTTGM